MNRILLVLVLMLSSTVFSQLDVLHYVPPLYGRTNVQNHYVIISTPTDAPVNVTVKRGNGTVLHTRTITSVTPATIFLGTGYAAPGIIGTAELNQVNTQDGFIVEATAPVYVNLRHVQNAQGLSLTSKGAQTGLGRRFRSGHIYSSNALPHVKAHLISVMAVENGTTVNFGDISPGVIFRNTPTTGGKSDDISVILNAGESYTIATWANEPSAPGNINNVNGTLITSNKDIVCNTGSWLSGAHENTRDIGVDQLVPVELIGKEYIFIAGDGNANTERPLIVAEHNGTQIFVNGSAAPVATINAGEYLYLPQTAYSANNNIYIATSQPVFMYQSLSGSSPASTSLNFIPPLRCNGFKKVVIPSVNLVGVPTISITARANASVYVNGSATALIDGLTVPGNECWLTYRIPGGTGNFTVESDSIINVALLTLQGPRGSAGYFTGFAQFTELDRGDTTSFVVCGDETESFITYNIPGPYTSVVTTFKDPSLGGAVIINETIEDTVKFTYMRSPTAIGPDSLEIKVCMILDCCGAIEDTICEESTMVFDNIQEIQTGLGDSIAACADTSTIELADLLLGIPDAGGYWTDVDGSGALFGNSFDPSVVSPGVYRFVYYVNGESICFDSTVVTVNVLPLSSSSCCSISPDVIITPPTCNGLLNGTILITDKYADTYSLDGGLTFQPTGNFGSVGADTYSIQLLYSTVCVFDSTLIVTEPAPLTTAMDIDSISCNGECDGELRVTSTSGGTTNYLYSLSGSPDQATTDFTALCPGSKTLTVTDANGCELTMDTILYEPNVLLLREVVNKDEACENGDGSVTMNALGGTAPYTYVLVGRSPQASPIFLNLSAGIYDVLVIDAKGCTDDLIITIENAPGPMPFADVINDVTCNGGLNGSAIVGATNGTNPLTFALDGGTPQASNTFLNIIAGSHTTFVTDANGCIDSVNFSILEPSPLTYVTNITNVSCFQACDAEIEVNASGGTLPYTYSDDGGATFSPFNVLDGLCSGDVFLVVRDAKGCLTNSLIKITEPMDLVTTFTAVDPSCNGTSTGELIIDVNGGVPAYNYSIDGGTTFVATKTFLNLLGGNYTVVVEDNNGCQFSEIVALTDPPPFQFSFDFNDPSNCGNNDGRFRMLATGGRAPYQYSINAGSTYFPDGLFTNLFSGLYTLYAIDNDGCLDSVSAALSDNEMTGIVQSEIPVTCYSDKDGSVSVSQMGGTGPYSYEISTTPSLTQNNGDFAGLEKGTYYVTVTDIGLCVVIIETNVQGPDSILFDASLTNITCPLGADGEIVITGVTGGAGAPFEYSIDGGLTFLLSPNFSGLQAGDYEILVKDANDCLGSKSFTLTQPKEFEIYVDPSNLNCNGDNSGSIFVAADDAGGPDYIYTVNGISNTNGLFLSLAADTYIITIEDGNGCTIDTSAIIIEPAELVATYVSTNTSCNGTCDGEITVTPGGGTQPYLYSSDGGLTIVTSSGVLGGLCPGNYDIYLGDNNGCDVVSIEAVTAPNPIELVITSTAETCKANNATINLIGAGGTPNYSFSIDAGTTFSMSGNFINLSPTYYDLRIRDNNGCSLDSLIEVQADPMPNIVNVNFTEPICNGGAAGSLNVVSNAGVGAHEYSITSAAGPYQTSSSFMGLLAGSYIIYVKDVNGCVVSQSITMNEPDALAVTGAMDSLTCFENNSGRISLIATGGTLPYSYSIDNGVSFVGTNVFPSLSAGAYNVSVQDINNCRVDEAVVVDQPDELIFDQFFITDASCFGSCDGEVSIVNLGGTTPYSYSWSGDLAGSGATANNVCQGAYTVVVNDFRRCSIDSVNFIVDEPDQAIIDATLVESVSCFEDTDGAIEIVSSNASFYSIGGPFSGNTMYNGLASGKYWVHVQDLNGCLGDSLDVFVPSPNKLEAFITPDEYICPGDTVYPSIVGTGGTTPYVFDWNLGASAEGIMREILFSDTTYYANITDVNGCSYDTDTMFVITAPPPILNSSNDTTVCPGLEVYIFSYAEDLIETYLYDWESGQIGPDIYPIINSDTMFIVTATDECLQQTNDTIRAFIFDPPIISLTPNAIGGCAPFQVNYTLGLNLAELGSDLTWLAATGTIDSSNFDNLYITYPEKGETEIELSFTSSEGCEVDTTFENVIEFYDPPIAAFLFDPEEPTIYDVSLDLINDSELNFDNFWTMLGDTTNVVNERMNLVAINPDSTYEICLLVENEYGCRDSVCRQLKIIQDLFLFVPNAIIVGTGGPNAVFKPVVNYFHPDFYSLQVFNRWGELLFTTENVDDGWDGTYAGSSVYEGVYIWKINGAPFDDPEDLREYYGHITVLK